MHTTLYHSYTIKNAILHENIYHIEPIYEYLSLKITVVMLLNQKPNCMNTNHIAHTYVHATIFTHVQLQLQLHTPTLSQFMSICH